jgi:hypothetical protein
MLKELPSAVCEEDFPDDPDFPQLKVATDPALMLEVFRTHLKPVSRKAYHIQDCTPVRFRCRQSSSRFVLQYSLHLVERSNGRHCDPWVTLVGHAEPGRTEELWTELKAADSWRGIPETLLTFEPLSFIPDLKMLVEVFPYDSRLPTLPVVLSGPSPELQRRLLAHFGPGDWQLEEQIVEPMRYRTELGGVLRYTLHARNAVTSRTQTKRFYAKVYRGERGERTWKLLQHLCDNPAATRGEFAVVRPIDYCRERQCLVLEEAPGRALQEVLLNGGDSLTAARRVARAVAAFNQSAVPGGCLHTPQDQIKYLTKTAALLQWICPKTSEWFDKIVAEVSTRLVAVEVAPIHWDLKTDHVFLDDDRVIFIDVDTVAWGDPVRDPAHLLAHIICRIGLPTWAVEASRAAGRAFVEEYFTHVPPSWHERFDAQYAAAVVETAAGIFKRQEPQWAEKVTACINEAHHALSGGFR